MLKILASCAMIMTLFACSDNNSFSGSSENSSRETAPATANANSTPSTTPETNPINAPGNAVTKGSFSIWAEPSNPLPKQAYQIHIMVKLKAGTNVYQYQDLSGHLAGTDGYTRGIGRDSHGPYDPAYIQAKQMMYPGFQPTEILPQDQFTFSGNVAQVSVSVPGAARLVKDTVTVRSDALDEQQQIEITFSGAGF